MTALMIAVLAGLVALAVDLGYVMAVRCELQRAADSAALAGAWELAGDERIRGYIAQGHDGARNEAIEFATLNHVSAGNPELEANWTNSVEGDIVVGYVDDPAERSARMSFMDPGNYNTMLVRLRCTEARNSPIPLFFARVFGINTVDLQAEAAAAFRDAATVGFRVTEHTGNASLMPFAVDIQAWEDLLDGQGNDIWTYDPETRTISPGQDDLPELNMFPGGGNAGGGGGNGNGNGGNAITPGNYGTVDVGNPNNGAPDLRRQIREGVSAEDLAYHGGELRLDPVTGRLLLNGDTGMTVSMKSALEEVVGAPRTIMLYNQVSGQGNNTYFTIVGFAGARVMDFNLNGGDKYISVQPAIVVDDAAIAGDSDSSYFVTQPVRLVNSAGLVQ
jgi:hypothetical protein